MSAIAKADIALKDLRESDIRGVNVLRALKSAYLNLTPPPAGRR